MGALDAAVQGASFYVEKIKLFSLQNSKTTYYEPFQPISTVPFNQFHFLIKLVSIGLKCLCSTTKFNKIKSENKDSTGTYIYQFTYSRID